MKVLLPAILSGVASRKDRSYTLKFDTRELSGKEASALLDQLQNEGHLLFSPNDDLTAQDVPDEKADAMLGTKTQAQRLRSVIFLLWKEQGEHGSFDDFYKRYMEQIIDLVKAKLD